MVIDDAAAAIAALDGVAAGGVTVVAEEEEEKVAEGSVLTMEVLWEDPRAVERRMDTRRTCTARNGASDGNNADTAPPEEEEELEVPRDGNPSTGTAADNAAEVVAAADDDAEEDVGMTGVVVVAVGGTKSAWTIKVRVT